MMPQKKLLILSFFTILCIAILHISALRLHWYFTHRWIDIVIHILGGFWVALTAMWLAIRLKHIEAFPHYRKNAFIIVLFAVALVGIAWELFELLSGNTFLHTSNFWTDSVSDMINNFLGGAIAYLCLMNIRKQGNIFNTNNNLIS